MPSSHICVCLLCQANVNLSTSGDSGTTGSMRDKPVIHSVNTESMRDDPVIHSNYYPQHRKCQMSTTRLVTDDMEFLDGTL